MIFGIGLLLAIAAGLAVVWFRQSVGTPWSNTWAGYLATGVVVVALAALGSKLYAIPWGTPKPAWRSEPAYQVGFSYTHVFDGPSRLTPVARPAPGLDAGYLFFGSPDFSTAYQITNGGPEPMRCSMTEGDSWVSVLIRPGETYVPEHKVRDVRCLPSRSP